MSSRLDELIARAKAKGDSQSVTTSQTKQKPAPVHDVHRTKVESVRTPETNAFDEMEEFMGDINTTAIPPETDYAPDGLQIGDPVVGMNRNQRMAGQVIAVDNHMVTVEWKNRDVTQVPADQLQLTNVDDAYEEEAMYIESVEPNMGFDKESFVEDTDLKSLLEDRIEGGAGTSSGLGFKYGDLDDL